MSLPVESTLVAPQSLWGGVARQGRGVHVSMASAGGHKQISLSPLPGLIFAVAVACAVAVFGDSGSIFDILDTAGTKRQWHQTEKPRDLSRLVDEVMKRDPTTARTAGERTYALADTNRDGELSDEERTRLVQEVLASSRAAAAAADSATPAISDDEFASVMNELLTEYEQSNPRSVRAQRPEWDARIGVGRKYSPVGTDGVDSSAFGEGERQELLEEVIADVKAKHDSAMGMRRTHTLADTNRDGELSDEERTRLVQEVLSTREAAAADSATPAISDDEFASVMNELLTEYEQDNPRSVRAKRPEWDARIGVGRKYEM